MSEKGTLGTIERMTPAQRLVHLVLMVAVLMLVISGLALAYHEQGWAHAIIALMGGLGGRTLVHRTGAVVLILVFVYHIAATNLSANHQRNALASVPKLADLRAGWAGFVWHLTGRGEPPKFGHYTPTQKIQYWLIFLGCLLMGLSGAVLWSPRISLEIFPKSFFDLMLVVHSSQAQFAFIILLVWHLWDVHIAGGNFPMNPAWLTGRMREDLFRSQHEGEWESIQEGTKE